MAITTNPEERIGEESSKVKTRMRTRSKKKGREMALASVKKGLHELRSLVLQVTTGILKDRHEGVHTLCI